MGHMAKHKADSMKRKILFVAAGFSLTISMMVGSAYAGEDSVTSSVEQLEEGEVWYTVSSADTAVKADINIETDTNIEVHSDADTKLKYTQDEFSIFTRLLCAEAGGENEAEITATAWVIRNRIETRGSFYDAIFELNAFEPANVMYGEIATRSGYVITDDDVTPKVQEIARGVLNGTIPSPVEDWEFFLGYRTIGFEDPEEFAATFKIEKYRVIGNTIFFRNWNEELNSEF